MEQRTKKALEELRRAPWFARVGNPEPDLAWVLHSWAEAGDLCSDIEWEGFLLDAANDYRDRLREVSPRLLDTWNDRVINLRPKCDDMVQRKIRLVTSVHNMPQEFEWAVRWDILNFAMECEYADVCAPGFFTRQAYWYLDGHFPCGWEGPFPQGRPIVY